MMVAPTVATTTGLHRRRRRHHHHHLPRPLRSLLWRRQCRRRRRQPQLPICWPYRCCSILAIATLLLLLGHCTTAQSLPSEARTTTTTTTTTTPAPHRRRRHLPAQQQQQQHNNQAYTGHHQGNAGSTAFSSTTSATATTAATYTTSATTTTTTRTHRQYSLSPFGHQYDPHDPRSYYTDLGDVWFCIFMALGWLLWMLSSVFVRSSVMQYLHEGVVVYGNVLQTHHVVSSDSGLPVTQAIVDYKIAGVHVRKQFETVHKLEQGFANVPVLVLPMDSPTTSILQHDLDAQLAELDDLRWNVTCRRISLVLSSTLVLLSIAGSVVTVERLDPLQRHYGYVSLVLGTTLLLPTALLLHRGLVWVQRRLEWNDEKQGVIISSSNNVVDDDEEEEDLKRSFGAHSPSGRTSRGGAATTANTDTAVDDPTDNDYLHQFVADCDQLDVLDARACDDDVTTVVQSQKAQYFEQVRSFDVVPETAGCYFIRLPQPMPHSSKPSSHSNSSVSGEPPPQPSQAALGLRAAHTQSFSSISSLGDHSHSWQRSQGSNASSVASQQNLHENDNNNAAGDGAAAAAAKATENMDDDDDDAAATGGVFWNMHDEDSNSVPPPRKIAISPASTLSKRRRQNKKLQLLSKKSSSSSPAPPSMPRPPGPGSGALV